MEICYMPPAGIFLVSARKIQKNRPKGTRELPLAMPFPFGFPQALLLIVRLTAQDFKKCVALKSCVLF